MKDKTEIIKVKGDWVEVVNDARATVGKEGLGKEPSEKFKRAILIAEHSPIRDLIVKWKWLAMPSWVSVHWVRHKWEKFVRTQRTDRTGIDRTKLPQDAPVDFTGDANAHALIDTMRKRLCYQASPETREYAEDFKATLHQIEPELADVLVPNCIYRCGCPEMSKCPFGERSLFMTLRAYNPDVTSTSILKRYAVYNAWFGLHRKES